MGVEGPSDLRFNTTPNYLTLLRMGFVPVVVGLLFVGTPTCDLLAAIAFGLASITDAFDGYIARIQKAETLYGKLLDPLADKFLVATALIGLMHVGRIHPFIVMILICREIAITGLRALASAEGVIIPAGTAGKWKTGTQMVAIPFMMVQQGLFNIPLFKIGEILLYISLAISLWSAKDYAVDFFRGVREKRKVRVEERKAAKERRIAERAERRAERLARSRSDNPV